jgi:uncharacterized protein DUF4126
VHLVFDILTGIGVAAAVGIRPFLAALVVGILAAANVEIHFSHTGYSFLQSLPFLLAMALCVAIGFVLATRLGATNRTTLDTVIGIVSLALGALFFAGSLARGHYVAWPGLIGGVVCAAVGIAASLPLLRRVRARLDAEAAAAVAAGLSVIAPPVGIVVLVVLVWFVVASRGRSDQKYAGLRILR